jgi:hypothetical protein
LQVQIAAEAFDAMMLGVVGHETKELDIEESDALVLGSMEHDTLESAAGPEVFCHNLLVWALFLDLDFLCFKKGALGSDMPT